MLLGTYFSCFFHLQHGVVDPIMLEPNVFLRRLTQIRARSDLRSQLNIGVHFLWKTVYTVCFIHDNESIRINKNITNVQALKTRMSNE